MSINSKKINTSLSVRTRNQNIHFINKKTNDFLLTITATKTVKPNANDIIVWSPNVHAAHAKKFNKNIPGKKNRDADTKKREKLRQSIYHLQIATNDNRKCGLIYSLFRCFSLTYQQIQLTMHLLAYAFSMTAHWFQAYS